MKVNVALQFEDLFFAAKALWLIRSSLNEIPSSGFDSFFTLLSIASSPGIFSISSNIGNKCAQFAQIYNNDPRAIISKSFEQFQVHHSMQMILSVFFRIFPFIQIPSSAGYSFESGKNVPLTSTL